MLHESPCGPGACCPQGPGGTGCSHAHDKCAHNANVAQTHRNTHAGLAGGAIGPWAIESVVVGATRPAAHVPRRSGVIEGPCAQLRAHRAGRRCDLAAHEKCPHKSPLCLSAGHPPSEPNDMQTRGWSPNLKPY